MRIHKKGFVGQEGTIDDEVVKSWKKQQVTEFSDGVVKDIVDNTGLLVTKKRPLLSHRRGTTVPNTL